MKKTLLLISFSTLSFFQTARSDVQSFIDRIEEDFYKNLSDLEETLSKHATKAHGSLQKSFDSTKESLRSGASQLLQHSLVINTQETESEFIVEANVAGFEKEEIKAIIEERNNNKSLTITAESKIEKKEEKKSAKESSYRSSFSSKKLQRTISLPTYVDLNNYTKSHENGVFKLIFKLKDKPKTKTITITLD